MNINRSNRSCANLMAIPHNHLTMHENHIMGWNIFCSTTDGRWFAPKPALAFETPLEGNLEVRDINGDGRSDLIFRPKDDARMFIFLSQSQRTKGNP